MDETERRRLIVLDMKLRLRDSRDPILAQKEADARRKRDTPAAQEATRELLRQHARSLKDDVPSKTMTGWRGNASALCGSLFPVGVKGQF
jgi:hypothetical protein